MTLLRFLEYIEMDRWGDVTYRAYDLRAHNGPLRAAKAMRRVGYKCPFALNQALVNHGVKFCDTVQALLDLLCEWYVWDRIVRGEITRWPLRRGRKDSE